MSRLTTEILGAIGLSLVSGAAQFALGRDMSPVPLNLTRGAAPAPTMKADRLQSVQQEFTKFKVNRAAKSDRAASLAAPASPTKTVSLRPEGFSDTSFLLRVPDAQGNSSRTPPRLEIRKPMVACEPVVSVLTEIANRLQPGRCVT